MAVLFTSGQAPVEAFFYATPPRTVITCSDPASAITALQERQCKYALVPDSVEVPEGLEIRTVRQGFALLQREGQWTRSDRRAARRRQSGSAMCLRPQHPYFWP